MRAALVYSGGDTPDNQDTLVQVQEISAVLKEIGMEAQSLQFDQPGSALEDALRALNPDFVFNLVETVKGTDSLLHEGAAFFEALALPYTGCPADVLMHFATKTAQKTTMRKHGLPTPDFFSAKDGASVSANGPWIVKSDTENASFGMDAGNVVNTAAAARRKIKEKERLYGGVWFAEHYIDGREFNISVLDDGNGGAQILPPAEIVFVDYPADMPKIVDYAAKWEEDSFAYSATQRRLDFSPQDGALLQRLEELCLKCWSSFGLKGIARVDFRVDHDGQPWILEVNPNPCLSSDAGFMAAAARVNMTQADVIRRLIEGKPRNGAVLESTQPVAAH